MNIAEAVAAILRAAPDALCISSLGSPTSALRSASGDGPHLYLGGSMGCALGVALGVSERRSTRSVVALLGDGEALMGASSFWSLAGLAPSNLLVVVLEDGAYTITGGQSLVHETLLSEVLASFPELETARVEDTETLASLARPGLVVARISERVWPGPSPFVDPHWVRTRFEAAASHRAEERPPPVKSREHGYHRLVDEDEWRVEVELDDDQHGYSIGERLRALDLDDEARKRLGHEVHITRRGSKLFVYAKREPQAREAERTIRELIAADDLTAQIQVTRWHPAEEEWEDSVLPLPTTEAEVQAERARHERAEAEEAIREKAHDWYVKVVLRDRHQAIELERRLRAEGHPVRRRWKYVRIGVLTEALAFELAEKLRQEAPPRSDVWVESNLEGLAGPPFMLF